MEQFGPGIERWITELRPLLGSPLRLAWLRRTFEWRSHAKHPLIKIMLTLHVSESLEDFENSVAGPQYFPTYDPPSPDRWAPEWVHALRDLAAEGLTKAQAARQLGRSHIDVRFYATRLGIGFATQHRIKNLTKAAHRILAGEAPMTVVHTEKIPFDTLMRTVAELDPDLAERIQAQRELELRTRHRADIEHFIDRVESIWELKKFATQAYEWALVHDHAWVCDATQHLVQRTTSRERVALHENDRTFSQAVSKAASLIKMASDYPRISARSLFDAAGLPTLIRRSPSRFPLTHAAILSEVESTEAFGLRKLRFTMVELARSHREISRWDVLSRYQLPTTLAPRAAELVHQVARELGLEVLEGS